MKFLHAADIHLDSPLLGLSRREDLPADLIANSTRRALANLIDLAIAEDVAFVIIAGDLYDGDWCDFSTGLAFAEAMGRLERPCFLVRGNHDAASVITRSLKLPRNVHLFAADRPETFDLSALGVALHGQSFATRAVEQDLSAGYPPPVSGRLNIGVLHSSGEGSPDHDTYAPCRISALALHGYDYWALGHIHARRVAHERPWIVWPGNLQGRHARETGPKGTTLVSVQDGRISAVEHRPLDVLRWAAIAVELDAVDPLARDAALDAAVERALAESDGRPVLARLGVTLPARAPRRLLVDEDELAAACRSRALDRQAQLWVESVEVRTAAGVVDDADLPEELREAFMAGLNDPATVETLLKDFGSLRQQVPGPARPGLAVPEDADGLRAQAEAAWQEAVRALGPAERG